MLTDMMNRVQLPDQTELEIHDVGRGQPNGIATLNANKMLVQDWDNLLYGTQIAAPAPYANRYNLVQWLYLTMTGGLA